MRISDWSSDVCSSDLDPHFLQPAVPVGGDAQHIRLQPRIGARHRFGERARGQLAAREGVHIRIAQAGVEAARAVEELRRRIACAGRSEEHTSELQSLMRISYAVFCMKKKK